MPNTRKNKIPITCAEETCREVFFVLPYEARKNRRFCSISCASKNHSRKKGYQSHLKDANENRSTLQKIDGTDKRRCSICSTWKGLEDFSNGEHRCKNCSSIRSINYYNINKKRIREQRTTTQYREKFNRYLRVYDTDRRKTDINYKLKKNLRARLYKALKVNKKSDSVLKLVDCSLEELKIHLESQFSSEMTWDNYGRGGWEVDHIRPCATFDLSDSEQQQKCFHYSNLQPLWGPDNWKKSDKWSQI